MVIQGGKLGRLRRFRVGSLVVPVRSGDLVRGPRARSALRLKEILARGATPTIDRPSDVDEYEPPEHPAPPRRSRLTPTSRIPGNFSARLVPLDGEDEGDNDEDEGDDDED